MRTLETHVVTVTGSAAQGEGVARLADGFVVFITGAVRGDICEIKVTSEASRSCRAEIVRIIEPSPHRTVPDCPVYPDCGGCDFRHISYEEELRIKLQRVNNALQRIGGLSVTAEGILFAGQTDGYRNKAIFHSEKRGRKTVTGFYKAHSHDIIPLDYCRLLPQAANTALGKLRPAPKTALFRVGRNGLSVYDADGESPVVIKGNNVIEEELDGLVFQMSPGSFFQVNPPAALLLYQKASEYAALRGNDCLLDLYCGVGAVTLFLGRGAGRAVGVECVPSAVEDARENAKRNKLEHIEFIQADAAQWDAGGLKPDCVTVDPPRAGLESVVVNKILKLSPRLIVYISCDPATLARDIKRLEGYEVRRVCAVDLFPRTKHVETVVLLSKLKSTSTFEVKIDLDEMYLTKSESKATHDEIK